MADVSRETREARSGGNESLTGFDADSTPLGAEILRERELRERLEEARYPRPTATRVITVSNQKGGVGKTTSTVHIAAALALAGLNTLVIDLDPQGNTSTALDIPHTTGTPSIYECLIDGEPLASVTQRCPDIEHLWVTPATIDLSGAEIELVSVVSRETRLQRALETYFEDRRRDGLPELDYVFIDCPPSLGLLVLNAFTAASEVLIPIQAEYYALEGLGQLLNTIEMVRTQLNPRLRVSTILLTMFDARTNLAQDVASDVREHFPAQTLATSIPRSVRISEAPSHSATIMTYEPHSAGALAYRAAALEIARAGAGEDRADAGGDRA